MNFSDNQINALINSVPKFIYIKMDISNKIGLGQLKPGEKIMTEEELCKYYNCSRLTVRNALNMLVNEGFIVKSQGRGTFVSKILPQDKPSATITSCTELIKSQNMIPSKKIIKCALSYNIDDEVRNKLQIDKTSPVLEYVRVYFANDVPVVYCRSYYNAQRLPGIENVDFANQSIIVYLTEKYGIKLRRTERVLSAKLADVEIASQLCTPKNYPLLQVTDLKTAIIQNQEIPIEFYTFQYVTDRIKYYPEVE